MSTLPKTSLFLCSLFFVLSLQLSAQDTYHNNLQTELQTNYDLPEGDWVLNETEAANLAMDFNYGNVTLTDAPVFGQDFSQEVGLDVTMVPGPQWSSGYGLNSVTPVNAGDRCLLVVWMHSLGAPGKVSIAVQDASTFAGEFYQTVPVADTWGRYLIPIEISNDYAAGGLQFAFQLNWQDQLLEIGGLAVLNYGTDVELSELPTDLNNEFYDGWAPDAPWRAEAAQRIENMRKADLEIEVVDGAGMPIEGAQVEVNMQEHEFGFGTAVTAQLFADNNQQNNTYEDHLLDLDGKGHRFNCVVFENATKWKAWEDNWFGVTQDDKANTAEWLVDRGFKLRGHTLVWPKYSDMPNDIEANANDPDYVRNRVMDHIEDILEYPGLKGNFSDWDVLNEISVLDTLANIMQGAPGYTTGREIYAEIFEKYKEIEPDGIAYLNDFTVFGAGESPQAAANLKTYTQELIDAGVQVDGIGFQGHIGTYPTGIPRVYDILEDYNTTFGTAAKITEYDIIGMVDDELAAKYLTDFYTIVFSHESADAILMWGFWDGAHWYDNAPMFYEDWTLKPAGEAFLDLVFNEWWTEETGQTDADGKYSLRGFKGVHEVTVDCNGIPYTESVNLSQDSDITIDCSMASSVAEPLNDLNLKIYPNPTTGLLQVTWEQEEPAQLRLLDMMGAQQVVRSEVRSGAVLELDLPAGMYILELLLDDHRIQQRLVIE
jgi:endo-1,4-beta-xylanase